MRKLFYIFLLFSVLMPVSMYGQSAFMEKINSLGYEAGVTRDWTDSTEIAIPEPRCAYVNLSGITKMPRYKNHPQNAWFEFYDGNGNYFKKRIIIDAQGNSSLGYPKRNFKIDICEDEWIGDKTPDVSIGDWVAQDGFHFKAYYYDRFRGIAVVSYKLYDQVIADRGGFKGRAWSRSGVSHKKFDEKALCHPDGFPSVIYLNGQYLGLFSWQLSKNRKNMNLIKDVPEMIHIDGETTRPALFAGNARWNNLEIRNPKSLYLMNGEVYDKDARGELMDETSEFYDLPDDSEKVKKNKTITAKVKSYILQLVNYYNEMYAFYREKASAAKMREETALRFDVPGLIDYWLFTFMTNNYDGMFGNWQWATWDGKKWFVNPYDLDCTFGLENYGRFIYPPNVCSYRGNIAMNYHHLIWLKAYFWDDVLQRYAQLRDNHIFDTENIMSLLNGWLSRIDDEIFDEEWRKWPNSPCISEEIISENWEFVNNWSSWNSFPVYSDNETYNEGDIVTWHYRKWRAKTTTQGVQPCIKEGYTDSVERVRGWIEGRLAWMDNQFGYTPKPTIKGDVNQDGFVNVTDIMLIVNYILGQSQSISLDLADMNEDSAITVSDIMMIVNIILDGSVETPAAEE